MRPGRGWVAIALLLVGIGIVIAGAGTVGADGDWRDTDPNATIETEPGEPLTDEQIDRLVNRSMVRLEELREIEFDERPTVDVLTREEAMAERGIANHSTATSAYTNTLKQGLFYVGGDADAIAVREENRNTTVGGYYRIGENEIVLVAGPDGRVDEAVLAHELVHAWQDQRYDLDSFAPDSRDGQSALLGLIEGDAMLTQQRYEDRCETDWSCMSRLDAPTTGIDLNWGIYFADFQPYNDGPTLVQAQYEAGGWAAVDALYANPPVTTRHLLEPETYPDFEPASVPLDRSPRAGWVPLSPSEGPAHERVGPGRIAAMFMQTPFVQDPGFHPAPLERDHVIAQDRPAPFEYEHDFSDGWEGDRFHAYERGDETAFVWRIKWSDDEEATVFREAYLDLLAFHGAEFEDEQRAIIETGGFQGAYHVEQSGDTVTIVHAPDRADLGSVAPHVVGTGEFGTLAAAIGLVLMSILLVVATWRLLSGRDG